MTNSGAILEVVEIVLPDSLNARLLRGFPRRLRLEAAPRPQTTALAGPSASASAAS